MLPRPLLPRLFLLILAPALALPAQAQVGGRFRVAGSVRDPSGAVIPGATVSLLDQAGTTLAGAETDVAGNFQFADVRPGNYQVRARHQGFEDAVATVRVEQRAPASLRLVLRIAQIRQEVTVTDSQTQVTTEASGNLNSVTLDRRALEELPIFDQDYIGTVSRFLDPGAVATGGITLVVDGLESPTIPASPSAIQEVRINQNPYSAEFSRPGHGRIEIITKPGSPQYHGVLNFLFRDHRLNARNPFALVRPPEQRRVYEGHVTGPLGSGKKTSFSLAVNRQEEDLQAIVLALTPAGEVRENAPTPSRVTEIIPRVTHRVGEKHTLSFAYVYRDRTARNQAVGGFVLPEAGTNTEFREDEILFNHNGSFTPRLVNQFRFLLARYDAPTRSLTAAPRVVVLEAFTAGGAQTDQLRTERHFALHEVLSWSRRKHLVKTGLNIPDFSRRGLSDRGNRLGTYSFSTLGDYLAGRPFSFTMQAGNPRLVFIEKVVGGFVQDDWQARPNLSLSAGLRYDWQSYFHDNNNFSPRLSFAYAPGRKRATVLRGGAGFFYDRTGPAPIWDLLRYDGAHLLRYLIENPSFPIVFPGGSPAGSLPPSLVRLDPEAGIPYTLQYSFGIERQVAKSTTLTATWFASRGVGTFRSRDVNAPLPPLYAGRPHPEWSVVRQIESSGRMASDSLTLGLRGNLTKYFTGTIQYALGRAYNNTSGITAFPANNWDLRGEWARADYDQRHRFNLLGLVRAGHLFNLGLAASLNSGPPYTLTTGRDDNHDGLANDRPVGVPRNSRQGPGSAELDLRWARDLWLQKNKKDKGAVLTMALDAFNVLNHVNYLAPVGNLSSPFFGRSVAARPPRRLQVSARFHF